VTASRNALGCAESDRPKPNQNDLIGDGLVKKVLNVAVIGLGFGTQFLPIYQRHPNTSMYAICRRSKESLDAIDDTFGVEKRYTRFQGVLSDPAVDFVHINTPLGTHGALAIAALKAGKHVMCTVPMALSVEECEEIVRLVRVTGLKYMMAETVLYPREYLFIRQLYEQGKLGHLQFLQESHHQDMDGWPDEWPGFCRPCTTQRIASRRVWRSPAPRQNMFPASVRDELVPS
jgi:predicted dehydrogenase